MAFSPLEVSSAMANVQTSQNSTDDQPSPNETCRSMDDHMATNTTSNANDNTNIQCETNGEDLQFGPKKKQKTSPVWLEFKEIAKEKKAECVHCKSRLSILQSKSTTHLSRHLKGCLKRKLKEKHQQKISLQPISESSLCMATITLTDGKFDMRKMRQAIAHWILMHKHPFTIVEEEGFNMMQQRGILEWEKVSRNTIKKDCTQVYDIERKKLMEQLKNINKISVTTDLWRSTNQKIEYMVLTGHFVNSNWKLQKRILSFVHLPPPHRGVEIADNLYKCMKDWGIENKVLTISVDNASNNDVAIRILADTFSRNKKLLCGGKLFRVRCCAHILNLMIQDGLSRISNIIEDIHESVLFINYNEARLRVFSEIVQQLQLPHRKLILECKTRWNSTYEMLSSAIKFKEVFPRYKDRELRYTCCPSNEDWLKVEKVCTILQVFNSATRIISGSEYPTSNLFLNEVYRIKVLLDKIYGDEAEDAFIHDMVRAMKNKFDKYWGECNLLMAIAAILDPRCKMTVIEFSFPKMYPKEEARENIKKVGDALYDLYDEYVADIYSDISSQSEESIDITNCRSGEVQDDSSWSEYTQYVKSPQISKPQQSELSNYLEEGCHICEEKSGPFDALDWWRGSALKYRILSKMARDILAIPITIVASEATFSAGDRVIDTYRASLNADTVQTLICGGDWCRSLHGVKRKNKSEKKPMEIMLPIP